VNPCDSSSPQSPVELGLKKKNPDIKFQEYKYMFYLAVFPNDYNFLNREAIFLISDNQAGLTEHLKFFQLGDNFLNNFLNEF
jgi:hypothetical protein